MNHPVIATAALLATLSLSGCSVVPNGSGHQNTGAASNEVPMISTGEAGESNATFNSNNCVVHYNVQGQRTEQSSACTRNQIQKADIGMAATRREQGL